MDGGVSFTRDGKLRFADPAAKRAAAEYLDSKTLDLLTNYSPPAPASRLLATTRALAGGKSGAPGGTKTEPGHDAVLLVAGTVIDSVGAARARATRAIAADAGNLANAVAGILEGEHRPARDPALDAPMPGGGRDATCRAAVRLQRARVLAAAHATVDARAGGSSQAFPLLGYESMDLKEPTRAHRLFPAIAPSAGSRRPGTASSGTASLQELRGVTAALMRQEVRMRSTWARPPLPPEVPPPPRPRSPSPSPALGLLSGGRGGGSPPSPPSSRPGTASSPTRMPSTARPASATASFYVPGSRGPGGLPHGVPPLRLAAYTSTSAVATAARHAGRAATAVEVALARASLARGNEERSAAVRQRVAAREAAKVASVLKDANRESMIDDRTAFLRRQRAWLVVVALVSGLQGMRMLVEDERAANLEARRYRVAGERIVRFMRTQWLLRSVRELARKKRIVAATVGRWILRRNARKLTRASRIARSFLTQALGLSSQVRTLLAYRSYTRAVSTVAYFLRKLRTTRVAQAKALALQWAACEGERSDEVAAAILAVFRGAGSAAAPPVVNIMRTLLLMDEQAALDRAAIVAAEQARWARESKSDLPQPVRRVNLSPDRAALAAIRACLVPVGAHVRDAALARFVDYRRRDRAEQMRAWRAKVVGLGPHLAAQRRRLELVQRMQFKGPASMFVFDSREMAALTPQPPPRLRTIPSQAELSPLVAVMQDEWWTATGARWAAEAAGVVARAGALANKVGGSDAADQKLERVATRTGKKPPADKGKR
jgi:hypothetical protein